MFQPKAAPDQQAGTSVDKVGAVMATSAIRANPWSGGEEKSGWRAISHTPRRNDYPQKQEPAQRMGGV